MSHYCTEHEVLPEREVPSRRRPGRSKVFWPKIEKGYLRVFVWDQPGATAPVFRDVNRRNPLEDFRALCESSNVTTRVLGAALDGKRHLVLLGKGEEYLLHPLTRDGPLILAAQGTTTGNFVHVKRRDADDFEAVFAAAQVARQAWEAQVRAASGAHPITD